MLFPARYAARPAAYEVAERLLAGQDAPPGADASERALSQILTAAAKPGTESELADEASAVAAFLLASSPAAARRPWWRARTRHARQGRLSRRAPVLAGAFTVVALLGVYGTAAAGVLPPPMQRIAHSVLPRVPGPAVTGFLPGTAQPSHSHSGTPTLTSSGSAPAEKPGSGSAAGHSPGAGSGNQGSSNGQGETKGKGGSNGQGHGKGKGTSNAQEQQSGSGSQGNGG